MSVITGLYAWYYSINEILLEWEIMGIFEYVLPFLLIFAVTFGILQRSGILGENKGVNVVIAAAAGLLAIQSFTLRSFFRIIFPYTAIGLAILLVILILTGLFYDEISWMKYVLLAVGGFIAIVVVLSSLASYEWYGGYGGWWWQNNWPAIVTLAIIIGLMILVIFGAGGKTSPGPTH